MRTEGMNQNLLQLVPINKAPSNFGVYVYFVYRTPKVGCSREVAEEIVGLHAHVEVDREEGSIGEGGELLGSRSERYQVKVRHVALQPH